MTHVQHNGFVVIGVNNDGGHPAVILRSLGDVAKHILDIIADCETPLSERELANTAADLSWLAVAPENVNEVRGSEAWKERFYVSPLIGFSDEGTQSAIDMQARAVAEFLRDEGRSGA